MKKIIFILFLIFTFLINSKALNAFDFSWDSKWFYSTIADSIGEMESSLYKIDIVWEEWTKEKINKKSGNTCIKENLSVEEINYVSNEWKLDLLFNKIDDKCKDNWTISTNLALNLINSISSLDQEYKNQAKQKTNQLFNLWSTWIYADWFEWNAPFDLILDLESIDSILFMEESTIYEWNTDLDLDWEIQDLLLSADKTNRTPLDALNLNIINNKKDNSNNEFNDLKTFDIVNSENLYSSYLCSVENNNSWLNEDSLNFLNSDSKIDNKKINSDKIIEEISEETKTKKELQKAAIDNPMSSYSRVNDNSQFPCSSFFCIDIKFITYEHMLLWWWFQDISIEYLINRSNDHLKKFTNTSLVWSKMTMNNFELGLKDLNLPDVFHIWIQVTKKPVPILNIEKEDKEDESIYKTENQLKFYYEAYWLEYKRRNDLSLFNKVDADKQIALNSTTLTTKQYLEKIPDFNNYQNEKIKQKELMSKLIANETKIWIMSDFERQFKELELFNGNIKDYITNLDKILSNMLKIPSDTWAN